MVGTYIGEATLQWVPAVWSAAQGLRELAILAGDVYGMANEISADGRVVVGQSGRYIDRDEIEPLRWVDGGPPESLGSLHLGLRGGIAVAANSDGGVVVDEDAPGSRLRRAFRLSEAGGMEWIPLLPGAQDMTATKAADLHEARP